MRKYVLKRLSDTEKGVFGVFLDDAGIPQCVTLERPWVNNARNVSCIPTGEYKVVPHNGARFKNCYRLEDVPGRTAILIHKGNRIKDTEGCILVGQQFWNDGILQSKNALDYLRDTLPEEFMLDVQWQDDLL
jgi:hypothetical protein